MCLICLNMPKHASKHLSSHIEFKYNFLTAYPDVTFARKVTLGDPGCIQTSTSDIHGTHQVEPTHLSDSSGLYKTLLDGEVHGGDDSA